MTNSSAVCSVLFTQSGAVEETRVGGYVYRGDAATFHELEFRTTPRIGVKKGDACVDAAARIVDALRDDAFIVAQEVGCTEILKAGGIALLVEAMRNMFFLSRLMKPKNSSSSSPNHQAYCLDSLVSR